MTDAKKPPEELEDVDWDQALSDWENKTFVPEVAKDVSTDKPGALSGGPVSKTLYRPPVVTPPRPKPGPPPPPKAPPPPPRPAAPVVPPPPPAAARPPEPVPEPPLDDDEAGGATVIAAIPQELLRGEDMGPKSSSRGGGLAQLFARDDKREGASVDVSFDESQPRLPSAVRPGSEPPGEVITSAKAVGPRARVGEAMPLRRPSQLDPSEHTPDGALFDPFASPDEPRSAQSTRPGEDEVDDLLAQSTPPPPMKDLETTVAAPRPEDAGPKGDEARVEDGIPPSTTQVMKGASEPPARGPSLLVPDARRYDPNEETMVGSDADIARARAAAVAKHGSSSHPPAADDDEEPTGLDARTAAAIHAPTRVWPDEKPASAWLSESAREGLLAKATWLEEEARALGDKIARARALLVCSEILSTAGEREDALTIAAEARDLAPSLPLAHRQARALMPSPPDPDDLVEALDAEVKMTPAGPARIHSTLLAAEALRAAGDDEGATKRLDQGARIAATDVRAPIARAARALARGETASAALRLAESPELAPVSEAINLALRLRGVDRKEVAGGEPSASEVLLRARQALDLGDVATAAPLVAKLADLPELAGGATWLAASLGAARSARRADSARWLRDLVDRGDQEARRALVARGVELGDADMVVEGMGSGPLTSAERMALSALVGVPITPVDPHLDATAATPGMAPLAAAVAALSRPQDGPEHPVQVRARAERTAGSAESRALVRVGRLLASSAPAPDVDAALSALGESRSATAKAAALEMAARAGRMLDVSNALETWGSGRASGDERTAGALAAALVAEKAGQRARALEAYRTARAADPTNEAALRAIASLEQVDLVAEMNALADELGDGARGALARIEAVTRGEGLLPEPTRADLLERAHRAAPTLPFASFLAERIARRAGDVEEVLRWIRERRAASADPIESALDGVREALLVADRDTNIAAERLLDAHRARPTDVALRELCERMATEPATDRASWREQRAAEATGDSRTLLFLEAALEHEVAGDEEGSLRSAEAAAATDAPLGRIARERAELRAGRVSRLAEELLMSAKGATDTRERREAYERLAILDATARQDPASALLWHRSILEEDPAHQPSLRHVEHHLIGEGRDDELEPIATSIALALRGTGPGECTAHAELASRLRMRGTEGSWESTRDMVQLASSEGQPSLWSLRMLQAHARAKGDDTEFLQVTLQLLDRSPRAAEAAALLVRAGEAASRLGNLEQARSLLERAAADDAGDVVAWGLLADVCQKAGDPRGAAEACESLARSSMVREHQLLAWFDAGRIWSDEVHDDERAIVAMEAAAALDVAHEDVFDRLSRIYAVRKMQPELASLLERRIEGITDPDERLAMEVRRGRILLEVGDNEGARAAFEVALAEKPDDPGALSAFADLCIAQRDWEAAEQALVRLARLLPTPEEQRDVYARLGELYSRHLLNLSRAEVALKEVLRRAPDDTSTVEKLVEVYRRQNDPARAIELQQELIAKAPGPEDKRRRVVELAAIHEQTAHDNRRAEQTLEAARREFPQDVGVLRALAEFYIRHHQTPAVNILLDRAGADARRGLAAGRFAPGPFGVLATVFELRGKRDAAHVTQTMLAAYEGRGAEMRGASERAFDPRLDDLMAPEVLSPAMRALLRKAGEALDVAAAIDLRGLKAGALPPDAPMSRLATAVSHALGMGPVQVLASPKVGPTCLPIGSSPPTILLGEALLGNERLAAFVVLRALKLVAVKASAFGRTHAAELAVLVSAWLKCFNPMWQPQGINPAALNAAGGRVQAALPRSLDPDVGVLALEVAGNLGTQAATLGPNALAWGNRVALLALGDPNAALDAIAGAAGQPAGAPRDPADRATWIGRNPEARDLVSFAVSDAFSEARARLGIEG